MANQIMGTEEDKFKQAQKGLQEAEAALRSQKKQYAKLKELVDEVKNDYTSQL